MSVAIPVIMEMKPRQALRAWTRFMAQRHGWRKSEELYHKAKLVRESIRIVILNPEYHAEIFVRQQLANRLDEFSAPLRRG